MTPVKKRRMRKTFLSGARTRRQIPARKKIAKTRRMLTRRTGRMRK